MGHLFIINGDITRLACDAWLLPSDGRYGVTTAFAASVGLDRAGLLPPPLRQPWPAAGCYLLHEAENRLSPEVWIGDIGRSPSTDASHFARRAVSFVAAAAPHVRPRAQEQGRRALVATPVLGSGEGGHRSSRLHLLRTLIPALAEAAWDNDCDVALVTFGSVIYTAAQKVRRELETTHPLLWRDLPATLADDADRLAGAAKASKLVTFFGAGVGVDAGLPLWRALLDEVANAIGFRPPDGFERLDPRDQAAILQKHDRSGFDSAVIRALASKRYSLMHGLLASLPLRESVTTNFDTLYELAAETPDRPLAVIPGDIDPMSSARWLLKLHGTIGRDLVLTRSDYLGSSSTHVALRGIVQALLLTRHMLFVGYSLSDEDFHQLAHEVRVAMGEHRRDSFTFGTVLALFPSPTMQLLWDELELVSMSDHEPVIAASDSVSAGRRLAIFLDRIGSRAASDVAFVASDTMGPLALEDEQHLADVVRQLRLLVGPRGANEWGEVRDFLELFDDA